MVLVLQTLGDLEIYTFSCTLIGLLGCVCCFFEFFLCNSLFCIRSFGFFEEEHRHSVGSAVPKLNCMTN